MMRSRWESDSHSSVMILDPLPSYRQPMYDHPGGRDGMFAPTTVFATTNRKLNTSRLLILVRRRSRLRMAAVANRDFVCEDEDVSDDAVGDRLVARFDHAQRSFGDDLDGPVSDCPKVLLSFLAMCDERSPVH